MPSLKRKKRKSSRRRRRGVVRSSSPRKVKRIKLSETERKFPVPKAVQVAAKDGLRLVQEGYGGKGLTEEAINRARKLSRGVPISLRQTRSDGSTNKSSAQFMHAWVARHKVDKRPGWREDKTPGWVAWQIWGGDPAKKWVDQIWKKYGDG